MQKSVCNFSENSIHFCDVMRGPKFIRILGQIFNRFIGSIFNQFLGSKKCHFLGPFLDPKKGPKIVIFGVHFGPQIGTHFGGGTPPKNGLDWTPPSPPYWGGSRGGSGGGVPPGMGILPVLFGGVPPPINGLGGYPPLKMDWGGYPPQN